MWTKKEEVGVMGEWMERKGYFWYGANGCEFIAWKGSHQIFVYPCDDYPKPPSEVIQSTNRIETVEDFSNTLMNGHTYQVSYK